MQLGIADKIAVVTGASQGIGHAIAAALAAEGATVVITARSLVSLEAAAAVLSRDGNKVIAIPCDVQAPASIAALAATLDERFGHVDLLVNNAGGMQGYATFSGLTDEDWINTYDVNVLSVVRMVRALRPMMAYRAARIVNIASETGLEPERVYPHYAAAKAALINFSKSLSKELGREGIAVNCVSPGIIRTEGVVAGWNQTAALKDISITEVEEQFMKLRRPNVLRAMPGLADEVAGLVAFLCSPRASFIAGGNFRVDGGAVSAA